MPSRPRCAANRPTCDAEAGRRKAGRWSMPCARCSTPPCVVCRLGPTWRRPSPMARSAGRRCRASWRTGVSRSTTTSRSVRCAVWPSDAATGCSPVLAQAASAPRPSIPSSRPRPSPGQALQGERRRPEGLYRRRYRQSRRRLACQPLGRHHALELDVAGRSANRASRVICNPHDALTLSMPQAAHLKAGEQPYALPGPSTAFRPNGGFWQRYSSPCFTKPSPPWLFKCNPRTPEATGWTWRLLCSSLGAIHDSIMPEADRVTPSDPSPCSDAPSRSGSNRLRSS